MATIKRITNLSDYTTTLPYASQLFGVYQPLLGWKSKRIEQRFKKGFENDKALLLERLKKKSVGLADVRYKSERDVEIHLKPGQLQSGKFKNFDSVLLQVISRQLPEQKNYKPSIWQKLLTEELVGTTLSKNVTQEYTKIFSEGFNVTSVLHSSRTKKLTSDDLEEQNRIKFGAFESQMLYESSLGGILLYLVNKKKFDLLYKLFYEDFNNSSNAEELLSMLSKENAPEAFLDMEHLDPQNKEHIQSIALSPISVVHLFRQYFFELDTFLGTPVGHVWLSPGSTVELIEIHTRSSTTEKTLETTLDILSKSEKQITTQDEISDAVKEDNQQDIKFGASVTASYASIEATSSFDLANSQQLAKETTHRQLRQQTEKLSSEIRKNFKSTFKTVTEVTDVSSTKHTLSNSTLDLINYELRRKMRQVGVQVQDVGTFLCWQTYVDDPGKELGLAKFVHIAKPAELESIPHPEEIPTLQPFTEEKMITIPFISVDGTDADNKGEVYKDGIEVDNSEWFGKLEKIQADFVQKFVCSKSDYELTNVEFDAQGKPLSVSRSGDIINSDSTATFTLHLDSADFQGQNSIQVKIILHWSPLALANDAINQKNMENIANFKSKEKAEMERAYVEAVKERVEKVSNVKTRKSDELREEERIVIYRRLLQDMLLNGVTLPDDRTRHLVSAVINAIFDVDKMLYFVSPEWWRPRLHQSRQQLQEKPTNISKPQLSADVNNAVLMKGLFKKLTTTQTNLNPSLLSSSTVGWGGINDYDRDNYYITEESQPAKLGSSLGWLLQLDGDNLRNAFLNAPWVKAVIPIRPGKEEAAINWLKGIEGMNGITDDVIYHSANSGEKDINGNPYEGQKMIDVLIDLGKKIKKKYLEGVELGKYPKQDDVSDPGLVDEESTVTATPIDRVYEHGFFPLKNSFKLSSNNNYDIFDQWIEILPTDQIVPVEVKYDPKTGRQI